MMQTLHISLIGMCMYFVRSPAASGAHLHGLGDKGINVVWWNTRTRNAEVTSIVTIFGRDPRI